MNNDEPALVPQWLQKGGPPGTSGGHNFSSTSQFASRDNKSRPKRDTPVTAGRPGSTTNRDSTFGRPEREVPRRDRALRDSWQSSSALGGNPTSSYRPAPAGRGSRPPPDRLPSDNSRSSLDNSRDSFAPSTSSSSRAVFRTQSGPPLRDREDFGFGSGAGSYHDGPAFKPAAPRGVPLTGRQSTEKPPFDRDFPSLAGRSNVGKSWHSGNAPPEQQWTRLADAPDGAALSPRVSNSRLTEPAESVKTLGSKLASGLVDGPTSQPRMADTLQQATSHTANQAPSTSKARLDDLAVRQSKQLIPVVASTSARDKSKGKSSALNGPKHALAVPGTASGTGALISRPKNGNDAVKRGEEPSAGPVMTGLGPNLRRLPSGDPKPVPGTSAGGADGKPEGSSDAGDSVDGQTTELAKQPATKDLERQRTSFFQSLRRTSTKTVDTDKPAPPSSPSTPPAQAASPTNPSLNAVSQTPPLHASSNSVANSQQQSSGPLNNDDASGMSNGHERRHSWDASDPRSKVSAEEEAFLRSLGWTEAGDDEDEGLTEEEIAAFKANTQHLSIKSFRPTSQSFTGFSTFSPRPKAANGNANDVSRPSQLEALSSSDSDSDLN